MAEPCQVMIVEDDDDIRESLVDFLEEHGYRPLGAHHGRDALQKLGASRQRPRLIVLDLMMPVMDGRDFREEQLRRPELARIPVVVISAYRDTQQQAQALNLQHLNKPIDLRELLRVVEHHCA